MAIVVVFLQLLECFSDVGIGPSIIQSPRGEEPTFRNTAWTIQIIRGGALWVIGCGIAGALFWFQSTGRLGGESVYGNPLLPPLVAVASVTAVISG